AARSIAQQESVRPFDLAEGPLVRVRLLRIEADRHLLVMVMHHVVSDGWSMGVLVREVAALYDAFTNGRPSPLPALPVHYADFAACQRSWLEGEVLESELAFWRRYLEGAPPMLELPTDRPRPSTRSFRGAAVPFELSAELTRALVAFGRRENATLFMTLL